MIIPLLLCAASAPVTAPYQYSFTIWNWESTYRGIAVFRRQVDAAERHGFTVIELGAGWEDCEPQDGRFDFSMVDDRVAYVQSKGLGVRLRVNMADWPAWFSPELYQMPDGRDFPHAGGFPSVYNETNRRRQLRFAAELAKRFSGRGFSYTPGFSVHMEVKFSDWNSYEPSGRKSFRDWLAGRYTTIDTLNEAWGTHYACFAGIEPPTPAPTQGDPSLDAASNDWIRFREWGIAEWVRAFADTVRKNDPTAKISVPLGESFRRESAAFANLGYWSYSREADEVVHSYDFFWHKPNGVENVRAAVATMVGMTQRPVVLEIDGPYLFEQHGYTPDDCIRAARYALEAGAAGIQVCNWGASDIGKQTWMSGIGKLVRKEAKGREWRLPEQPPVLYYVSKWQQYCFREPTEWVRDRQFGFWLRLWDAGIPARIVTDENLLEEDVRAAVLILPFDVVVDAPVRERLRQLSLGMRVIADDKPGVCTATAKTGGGFGAKIDVTGKPFTEDPRTPQKILGDVSPRAVRIAAIQFKTTPNVAENTAKIVDYLRRAKQAEVRVVVFTEMVLTGYTKEASFGQELDWEAVDKGISDIRKTCRELGLYAIVGAPTRDAEGVYCAALAIDPNGEIIDDYAKIYLAGEKWARPGKKVSIFSIDGIRCGTFICHDERYAPLVQLRALKGAQIFFYISCESGVGSENKIGPYRAQIQARAVENGVYIVHANTPASRDNPSADGTSHGQSRFIAPDGNIIAEASIYDDEILIADIDPRHAKGGGLGAALSAGPLADWMQQGLKLVVEER